MLATDAVGRAPMAPARPTLVFDGRCGFCRRWVGRVAALDHRALLDLVPLQDAKVLAVTGQSVERLKTAVHFVRHDGFVFAGAAAVREVSRYLRGGRIVRGMLVVPGAMRVADWVYGWVAQRCGPVGDEGGCGTPGPSSTRTPMP